LIDLFHILFNMHQRHGRVLGGPPSMANRQPPQLPPPVPPEYYLAADGRYYRKELMPTMNKTPPNTDEVLLNRRTPATDNPASRSTTPPISTPAASLMLTLTLPSPDSDDVPDSTPPIDVPPTEPPEKTLEEKLETVNWTDIDKDDTGNAVGCLGFPFKHFKANQLRKIASRLKIKCGKNLKKAGFVEMIVKKHKDRMNVLARIQAGSPDADDPKEDDATAPKTQPGCRYRLQNLVMSDKHVENFANLGNTATRQQLDRGLGAFDKGFWEAVQKDFVDPTPNPDYDDLKFIDVTLPEDHFGNVAHEIDPSVIVNHSWKKLRQMWKEINRDYKSIITNFTASGTHENEFWSFCGGNLVTLYCRKWLLLRPNCTGMIEASLPAECQGTSNMDGSQFGDSDRPKQKRAKRDDHHAAGSLAMADVMSKMRADDRDSEARKFALLKDEQERIKERHTQQVQAFSVEQYRKLNMDIRRLKKEVTEHDKDGNIDCDIFNSYMKEIKFYEKQLAKMTADLNDDTQPESSDTSSSEDDYLHSWSDNKGNLFKTKREWKRWLAEYNKQEKRRKAMKRAQDDRTQPTMYNFLRNNKDNNNDNVTEV
jgi:hypothetical protein